MASLAVGSDDEETMQKIVSNKTGVVWNLYKLPLNENVNIQKWNEEIIESAAGLLGESDFMIIGQMSGMEDMPLTNKSYKQWIVAIEEIFEQKKCKYDESDNDGKKKLKAKCNYIDKKEIYFPNFNQSNNQHGFNDNGEELDIITDHLSIENRYVKIKSTLKTEDGIVKNLGIPTKRELEQAQLVETMKRWKKELLELEHPADKLLKWGFKKSYNDKGKIQYSYTKGDKTKTVLQEDKNKWKKWIKIIEKKTSGKGKKKKTKKGGRKRRKSRKKRRKSRRRKKH